MLNMRFDVQLYIIHNNSKRSLDLKSLLDEDGEPWIKWAYMYTHEDIHTNNMNNSMHAHSTPVALVSGDTVKQS